MSQRKNGCVFCLNLSSYPSFNVINSCSQIQAVAAIEGSDKVQVKISMDIPSKGSQVGLGLKYLPNEIIVYQVNWTWLYLVRYAWLIFRYLNIEFSDIKVKSPTHMTEQLSGRKHRSVVRCFGRWPSCSTQWKGVCFIWQKWIWIWIHVTQRKRS